MAGTACWPRRSTTASCAARSSRSPTTPPAHSGWPRWSIRDCFTVAPFAGHYEPLIECGAPVKRGDVVGLLHDFDHIDQDPWPAQAGVDGVVVAQAWGAAVPRGQHISVRRAARFRPPAMTQVRTNPALAGLIHSPTACWEYMTVLR